MDCRFCDVCKEQIFTLASGKVIINILPAADKDQEFINKVFEHLCADCGRKLIAVIKKWYHENRK